MYQLKSKLLAFSKTKMETLQQSLRLIPLSHFSQKVMPIWVLFILISNASCTRNQHELILVIAVEGLSSQKLVCTAESPENSGISQLCKESIRFTHAFTPSTLSAPTFASFLTGTYPIQHGLRNNSQELTTSLPTLPQEFLKQNYSTLMFSGSPPILSKTGLGRGFEVFNDHLSEYPYFQRSLRDSWSTAEDEIFSWRGLKKKTFLVLHTAELLSATAVNPSIQTASNVDYNEIALQNLDRTLSEIFQSLKTHGAWINSTVILMGVNGEMDRDFLSYPAPLNLKTSNTQVALFIKPPTKARDLDLNWSVDTNVSLVDVGRTLFDLFKLTYAPPDEENEILHPRSLIGHLGLNSNKVRTEQPILIESDWGRWRIRNKSNTRYALLSGNYLYIHDSKPKLYNILTDKMQVNNIYYPQAKTMSTFLRIADQLDLPPWNNFPSSWT
ncbi:MAG TPA: sulfatase-like hydrolase/transferase, partial [Pseudobdellovibrionaceae bacterium]|nr:sulfatase-like hydrolase/transferase [Pseudobdellovibrionaceae bacterium]